MQIASSANFTCRLLRSASEYTATVRIPISLHALITRSAISPRLAIRTLRNIQSLFLAHKRPLIRRIVKYIVGGNNEATAAQQVQNTSIERCRKNMDSVANTAT